MSDTPPTINGNLLRLKREERGWVVGDMATRACMSVKQIRQLEEGGSSSFYSESVKRTSAKKVGAILGLTPDEVFGLPAKALSQDVDPYDATDASHGQDHAGDREPLSHQAELAAAQTNDVSAPSAQSNPLHDAKLASTQAATHETQDDTHAVGAQGSAPHAPAQAMAHDDAAPKNKTPWAAIAALFVAALAVAAWMRPEAEPVAVEPPPPLQTLPADTPEGAASAASAEAVLGTASAAAPASSATPAPPVAASASVSTPAQAPGANQPAAAASASASKPL